MRADVWRRMRDKVLAERPVCEDCGQAGSERLGHRVPPAAGGSEQSGNVLALCRPCWHARQIRDRRAPGGSVVLAEYARIHPELPEIPTRERRRLEDLLPQEDPQRDPQEDPDVDGMVGEPGW